MTAKILLLDIETAPNTAYVWGLYDQNIATSQVIETGRVLSWAAKWYGDKAMMYMDERGTRYAMLGKVHNLLDEADAVVHYNGTKFDIPTLNKEFLLEDMPPPSPFRQIDLLKTMRSQFKFVSNKLDFIAQQLGIGSKVKHEGMELWTKCMAGDDEAWEKMRKYNIQDVILLEKLYNKLLPWIKGSVNQGIGVDAAVCPKCGSDDLQRRGFVTTDTLRYQRFQCNDCGAWSQEKRSSDTSVLKEAA